MDKNKKLSEELLKADGIDPGRTTKSERAVFNKLLDDNLQTKSSIFPAYKNLIRFAAVIAIAVSLIWILSTYGVKKAKQQSDVSGKTPAELMTLVSLRTAMCNGGTEGIERQLEKAFMMLQPRPNNLSAKDL